MDIVLRLLIAYIFFSFILIGVCFSKVKVDIKHLEFESFQKKVNKKYKICIGLYLYGFLRVINIVIEEDGIKILGKKISYEKIRKSKVYIKMKQVNMREFEKDFKFKELRILKPELKKIDLKLDLGFENVLLTSFLIFAISTILSITVRDTVKKYNPIRYKYIIRPHYRSENKINLKLNSIIVFKSVHIILILLNYKRRRVDKYERTSYRRTYENSYE